MLINSLGDTFAPCKQDVTSPVITFYLNLYTMKQFFLKTTVLLAMCFAAVAFTSCDDGNDPVVVPELSAAPGTLSFVSAGETKTIEVKAQCVKWQAATTAEWLTLADNSGSADGIIRVTAEPNTDTQELNATITISGEGVETVTIDVKQAGDTSPRSLNVNVKELSFTCGNYYTKTILVEAENVSWDVQSDVDWITLEKELDANSADGKVTVSVKTNTGAARKGSITLSGKDVDPIVVAVSQKMAFTSELIGMYKPYIADPENPIAEFFITPTYPEGTEEPEVDVSFIFGPGAMWPVSVVTSLANQMVGMLYAGGLDHFEFKDDGTFSAGYRNLLGFDMSAGPTYSEEVFIYPSAETLEMIPADAISYYTEKDQVYFAISKEYLSQIGQSELETDLTVLIEGLLEQYPEIGKSIVSNDEIFALPLNYLFDRGKLKLWVDREMMMPFIPLLSELVETMLPEEITVQMDPNDPQTAMTIPVKNLLGQLLEGLFTKTETLEIGISLAKQ